MTTSGVSYNRSIQRSTSWSANNERKANTTHERATQNAYWASLFQSNPFTPYDSLNRSAEVLSINPVSRQCVMASSNVSFSCLLTVNFFTYHLSTTKVEIIDILLSL